MRSTSVRRRASASALLCVALVACGGGGDDDDAVAARPDTTTAPPTSETTAETATTGAPEPVPPPVAPLTGQLLGDEALRNRPAIVVKVDDSPAALGRQEGIDVADLVFVEKVEGSTLRLAAVYHSTNAMTGPVRSARTSDLGLTGNLGRPLFAYSGANGGVLGMVRAANLVDLGFDVAPDVYRERGRGLLRYFLDTADLAGMAPEGAGPPAQQLDYREPAAPVANAGAEPAGRVTIRYAGSPGTTVEYRDEGMGWARVQGGRPHVVGSGDRIAPDNVIVQFVGYRSSGFVDVTGTISPEAVLTGEGEAWIFTGGHVVRARWSRPDLGARTAYTDAAGEPVRLAPGTTWVELADPGSATIG